MLSWRKAVLVGLAVVLLLALALGFREPPAAVEVVEVSRGPFQVTVEEEGRTRLSDRYDVSAPVSGFLGRVVLEPGDEVGRGQVLFLLHPHLAQPLDSRTRAQARATLARAESSLELAQALVDSEQARVDLARAELRRIERMVSAGHMPAEVLDQAQSEMRRATASLRSARFAVDVARHEKDNAEAMLSTEQNGNAPAPIQVVSPVDGVVLRRLRQSEGSVQAGEPIVSLGNLSSLEIEVDVLSPDAVRLQPGMRVELERWGGDSTLPGRVRRIEPAGFMKLSALGVEEHRVWVIVDLDAPRAEWQNLGDGFRVEARFILWEAEDVLQVPTSALFRRDAGWGTFVLRDGRARFQVVEPGRRSGLSTEVVAGLVAGDQVIVHPAQNLADGVRVRAR
ncbi:efflux RND transporter periplasmic adaptor subunit [Pseudomonas sp.]|uniref:efflux RND transporter periplasmic adaptor subunit n=1 Tax=Pseudomonas sp. TaxID=306 RepID=UPI00272CB779|nr:efflux RND transporter periplasmic adaptor subunit [Pseudomonas sp.]